MASMVRACRSATYRFELLTTSKKYRAVETRETTVLQEGGLIWRIIGSRSGAREAAPKEGTLHHIHGVSQMS